MIGVTHPTFTSILASWNFPSLKKKQKKGPVKNLLFETEIYSSKSLETDNSDKIRRSYSVKHFYPCQKVRLQNQKTRNRASRIT